MTSQTTRWTTFAYGISRSLHFQLQSRLLQLFSRPWITGGFPTPPADPQLRKLLAERTLELIREDSEYFARGVFPTSLLRPENPVQHGLRTVQLVADAWRVIRQKKSGRTQVFNEESLARAEEKPRYYQRNFHFQDNGYLSDRSAELYEHQVEVLFSGTADMMRRLTLRALAENLSPEQLAAKGKGLRILEVAAGTGRTGRMIHELLPQAHLTLTDLSEVYLKKAREKLSAVELVDFVQCAGENLPFSDEQYEVVVSVFLFHELPEDVRLKVLAEMKRVVRPGGWVIAVDSIQRHDAPELAPVLDQFPKDFHEPFYRNYIDTPLEGQFETSGMKLLDTRAALLAKLVVAVK